MNQEQIQPLGAETCPYVVLHGVDTLVINVRYTDEHGKPTRALLDEQFIPLLNEWQARAKVEEKPVPIPLDVSERLLPDASSRRGQGPMALAAHLVQAEPGSRPGQA